MNKAPVAKVTPVHQVVSLPVKTAIIDASSSTDDTGSESLTFKWELITWPLGYQNKPLPEGSTLTLGELVAGNYTLKVTVVDKDGASDSTQAKLVVNEETDYPPIANAGEDVILYLPKNEITLNGNKSTDDHGIVSWEWTRAGETKLAADSKNMRTSNPYLSNLEEGMYTYNLKVTDAKGQTSEDEVNIYVKPSKNQPPVANAGKDKNISLPKNWVVLDGTGSTDDFNITSWSWVQTSGPNKAKIGNPLAVRTNATGLTEGQYVFQLTVVDGDNNENSAQVKVAVSHDKNAPPQANAGKDVEVTLPQSVVVINGSTSYDDLRIARWRWTRNPKSLAAGKTIGNSTHEPVLYVVNLVPGVYIFDLKVS